MFLNFFYFLRQQGLKISTTEWLSLLEAMQKGLHGSTLSGFFRLCRAILIKTEADYDSFDQAFQTFFSDAALDGSLPPEFLEWLAHPAEELLREAGELPEHSARRETLEELLEQLQERLETQKTQHNGGNHWVGTGGTSPFGYNGWHPGGIRIGGEGNYRTASMVSGERRYRDFRRDSQLDSRQFQLAFRTLRQLTVQNDADRTELDLDGTVQDTCSNAGILKLRYRKPRKNAVKLLLLMDSGGSMEPYNELCSTLFHAAQRSNHLKELHIYYFHNTIYDRMYLDPTLWASNSLATNWVLNNYSSEYKVIIVGDASMDPDELNLTYYDRKTGEYYKPGLQSFEAFRRQYPHLVWLNPEPEIHDSCYWDETRDQLAKMFPMYQLTVDGLARAMKHLMSGSRTTAEAAGS